MPDSTVVFFTEATDIDGDEPDEYSTEDTMDTMDATGQDAALQGSASSALVPDELLEPARPSNSRGSGLDEDEDCSSSDSDEDEPPNSTLSPRLKHHSRPFIPPPSLEASRAALAAIKLILHPPRGARANGKMSGIGYKQPQINPYIKWRMECMHNLLELYTQRVSSSKNPRARGVWGASSETIRLIQGRGPSFARSLRRWTRTFIADHTALPENPYGKWTRARLYDEDLVDEIQLHLQSIGKYVRAADIVEYLNRPEVRDRFEIKKSISLSTAKRWMHKMGYRWTREKKGMYADGHERPDVVSYRQEVFIPAWKERAARLRWWSSENPLVEEFHGPLPQEMPETAWFHDESIFQGNDRRVLRWWHESETPKPYTKGEGPSLMVADFFSPDHGFLRAPDGSASSRVLFKPGKDRDGYWASENVIAHAETAMDIITQHFPFSSHTLYFDNAPNHLKRPEGSLSARKMPKGIPKEGTNWGVEIPLRDASGSQVFGSNGKPLTTKVKMHGARLPNGQPQDLYFPDNHPVHPGKFKGMAVILEERGFKDTSKLRAQCNKQFKCPPGATRCCCRRILFNERDFVNVETILERACRARGFRVIFLPKFHCELNPIEQCWGHGKRDYRCSPPSKDEAIMEKYVVKSLDSIPLESMRRYGPDTMLR
ncbi:hypothetical protein GSI_07041 [Ganoderma sinense ZZ0214-1]|uniref:Uncharacterized protein n=1 Tax=Ganoderma sinense ZZ0214-1 TaxID=1077348 RepID=A0A2G8SAW0_9APHY|nr:hypothetical protein GSI_07041 [Ganoderma sinense ZZ0214-1]